MRKFHTLNTELSIQIHIKILSTFSYEKIYTPIARKFKLDSYDTVAPIIKQALEELLNKKIEFVHNVGESGKGSIIWHRRKY